MGVRVRILGPVELAVDASVLRLTSGRARAVLAALALRPNAVITADELIDLVWTDAAPASVANQLQIAVFRLRKVIAAAGVDASGVLVTRPSGYQLVTDPLHLDLLTFRAAVAAAAQAAVAGNWAAAGAEYGRALGEWRGRACQDVTAEPITAAAMLLDRERADVVERTLAVELLSGHPDPVRAAAFVDADPLRERLWCLLVLGHALAGRQAEALAAYRRARTVLADELGLAPGAELQQVQGLVLRGEPGTGLDVVRGWFGRPGVTATGPSWQIPADLGDFTGREAEVGEAAAALASGSTVCIAGMGGVGKTTLAIRVAHELRGHFTGGGLFVDMRGTGSAPADPYDVMATVLRCLGMQGAAIPEDAVALAGIYRERLADRLMVIVLDDVGDEAQVRPLLPPGGGSCLIVTSRRSLVGLDGARLLDLDVPDTATSVALLGSIVGSGRVAEEPAAARQLAELCGRLPLALRIAGVRAKRQHGAPLARLVDRLTDRRARLDELSVGDRDVRTVFAVSFAQLSPLELTLLRRVGMLPVGHCPSWVAATLLDLPLRVAERVLEGLADLSLVTLRHTGAGPRFTLHDLTRLYAAELPDVAEDLRGRRRTYEMLLNLALRAAELVPISILPAQNAPAGGRVVEVEDGRGWFSRERTLLQLAARDAHSRGWTDLASMIMAAMANFIMLETYDHEWLQATESMLGADDDTAARADLLLALGVLRRYRGSYGAAVGPLRRARRAYLVRGDTVRAATAATHLGVTWRALGRRRLAWAYTDWAVGALSTDGPPPAQLGWALMYRGTLLLYLEEDAVRAQPEFQQALAVMRSAGDRSGEAVTMMLLAQAYLQEDPHDARADIFWDSVKILEEVGNPVDMCLGYVGLGWQRLMTGQLDEAQAVATRTLAQARDLRVLPAIQGSLSLLGRVASAQGRHSEARDWADQSVAHARLTAENPALEQALRHYAQVRSAMGDHEAARAASAEASELRSRRS